MKVNIGIEEANRKKIADRLAVMLADTYTLYVKTQNFHWNVTGPIFPALHLMFETQYKELADAVDLIAERIRALGFTTPASLASFSKLTAIKEAAAELLKSEEMVKQLAADHETLIRNHRDLIEFSQKLNDESTADLVIERLREHEKTAWMLRSSL